MKKWKRVIEGVEVEMNRVKLSRKRQKGKRRKERRGDGREGVAPAGYGHAWLEWSSEAKQASK